MENNAPSKVGLVKPIIAEISEISRVYFNKSHTSEQRIRLGEFAGMLSGMAYQVDEANTALAFETDRRMDACAELLIAKAEIDYLKGKIDE